MLHVETNFLHAQSMSLFNLQARPVLLWLLPTEEWVGSPASLLNMPGSTLDLVCGPSPAWTWLTGHPLTLAIKLLPYPPPHFTFSVGQTPSPPPR